MTINYGSSQFSHNSSYIRIKFRNIKYIHFSFDSSMFSFREALTQEFINQLINSGSVDDFYKILHNYINLPDDLILRIFLRDNLTEFEKIAISMAFTDLYYDMNSFISNLYEYCWNYKKQCSHDYR